MINANVTAKVDAVVKAVTQAKPSIDLEQVTMVSDVCKALALTTTRPVSCSEIFALKETREDAVGVVHALSGQGLISLIDGEPSDCIFYASGQLLDEHFQSNAQQLHE
jgi:hypothetical protein